MVPVIALLIQALLPVAVDEIKKKVHEDTPEVDREVSHKDIPTKDVAGMALQAVIVGSLKSKTAWVALAIAAAGFFEQNQGLISQLVGSGNGGYIMAVIGGIMYVLRTISTNSIVDKSEPKE